MTIPLTLGPVHHLRLTVTDVERSRVFYTELLGFQTAMDSPPPVASDKDGRYPVPQPGILTKNEYKA